MVAKLKQPRITGTDSVRYLRVSSPGQVETEYNPEGISLPAQREACMNRERELSSVSEPRSRSKPPVTCGSRAEPLTCKSPPSSA